MEKLQLISDRQVDSVDLNYEEVRSQELGIDEAWRWADTQA